MNFNIYEKTEISEFKISNLKLSMSDIFYNLLYELSEKIIINIENNLFNIMGKMIDGKFIQNTIINLCYLNYNEFYKYLIINTNSNQNNEIIKEILLIHEKYNNYDLLYILSLSFEITLGIIKKINRNQYNFISHNKFINSIQNQIELIKNTYEEHFNNIIKNHKCNNYIKNCDPDKIYFSPT